MQLRCTASREGKLESFLRRELSMSSSLVSRLKWQDALLVNGEAVQTDAHAHALLQDREGKRLSPDRYRHAASVAFKTA